MARIHKIAATVALAAASVALPAMAQELSPELQKLDAELPGELINDPTSLEWTTYGNGYQASGIRDKSIPGGGAARRFVIGSKGAASYSVATNAPLLSDIKRGDEVTVGFYARTISAETADGKGLIGIRFQQNVAPYGGFGDKVVKVGSEWFWHEVSAVAASTIRQNEAIVSFQLAGAKQSIEIGQTIVVRGASSIAAVTQPAATAAEPELPPQLQGVGTLLNRPTERFWGNSGAGGTATQRDEPKIWLGQATRFTTPTVGLKPWDLGTAIPISQPIAKGDTLLIAIAARTESASTPDGKALVALRIQEGKPPFDGFAENRFTVGPNWQLIRVRTVATRAFEAGTAQLALHFAGAQQSVDIGPVYIFKTP